MYREGGGYCDRWLSICIVDKEPNRRHTLRNPIKWNERRSLRGHREKKVFSSYQIHTYTFVYMYIHLFIHTYTYTLMKSLPFYVLVCKLICICTEKLTMGLKIKYALSIYHLWINVCRKFCIGFNGVIDNWNFLF